MHDGTVSALWELDAPLQAVVLRGDPAVVYDAGTNRLLVVDGLTAEVLPHLGAPDRDAALSRLGAQHGAARIEDRLEALGRAAKEKGWLAASAPVRFAPAWDSGTIRDALSHELDCLVLSVTSSCNLRCSYCLYGGAYPEYRNHGARSMSPADVEAAFDFFAARCDRAPELNLNFYGGEPLLNLPAVRYGLGGFPRIAAGRPVHFHMTTNGTMLDDDEVIDLLAEANVLLTVSLDGPEAYHDRRRKTAGGEGTWRTVMRGLSRVERRHPGYYRESVMINAVFDSPSDVPQGRRFFLDHPSFDGMEIVCSRVKNDVPPATGEDDRPLEALEAEFLRRILAGERDFDSFLRRLFLSDLRRIHEREVCPAGNEPVKLTGVCIPGRKELFVDAEGRFHPCENTDDGFAIGDLRSGFDFPAIERILSDHAEACNRRCASCWAFRLCSLCHLHFFSGRSIDEAKLSVHCAREKSRLLRALGRYYLLLKRDRHVLDFLSELPPEEDL